MAGHGVLVLLMVARSSELCVFDMLCCPRLLALFCPHSQQHIHMRTHTYTLLRVLIPHARVPDHPLQVKHGVFFCIGAGGSQEGPEGSSSALRRLRCQD